MRIDRLSAMILSTRDIDGVTFSGGEPFFQAGALANLARRVRSRGLSVITFSGHPYALLNKSEKKSWQCLMAETDLLVSGPYLSGQPSCHPLLGSSNQEIHYLTDRIDPENPCPETAAVTAEYTITPDGTMLATGFPAPTLVDRFRSHRASGGM
jgi:anaerobic ribonucleoside-triphosphate reductase activating protein